MFKEPESKNVSEISMVFIIYRGFFLSFVACLEFFGLNLKKLLALVHFVCNLK